jgi:hypothetical protein
LRKTIVPFLEPHLQVLEAHRVFLECHCSLEDGWE